MKSVAVIRKRFLPLTETFIYEELIKLNKYKPYVFTQERLNRKQFPFKRVKVVHQEKKWKRFLRRYNIKLIHARFGSTGMEMLKWKMKTGIPMITSFHGHDSPKNKKNKDKYRHLSKLFKHGEMFTVTNQQMKQILMEYGCPEGKIHIQHSGIDLNKFPFRVRKKPSEGPIRLLFVGRLVEKKGAKFLIKAFKKVNDLFPNTELTIIGEGDQRKKLKKLVKRLNLGEKVKMKRSCNHNMVIQMMGQSHLFCLPSVTGKNNDQEGIPNVLKEAMACGLPVISTYHSGIPELITHQKSGFLVPERDSKALAEQIIDVMNHPETWENIGCEARKKVEQEFNSTKQMILLQSLYDKVIKKHKKKH